MLLKKFFNVGFDDITVVDRRPLGLADIMRYPLFAPDFLDFLRKIMPLERHGEMVFSITVKARKPTSKQGGK
ncbi:MAG: hypothetical protein ACRD1X_14845 [Vicinamibacteria bacterium]